MSRHILIVDEDREGFTIECADPAHCAGWIECTGDHTGYDPEDEESPAFDEWEDVEIHGVFHDWRRGYGWTVPYPGCVVAAEAVEAPDELWERVDGDYLLKPGRWVVDDDWDDTSCYLTVRGGTS